MVVLGTGNFCSAQTAAHSHLDALCAQTHGTQDRLLHGAAERGSLFQLQCDILSNQLCIHIGNPHFDYIDGHRLLHQCLQLLAQILNFHAALSDHKTGLGAMDKYLHSVCSPLDLNLGDTGFIELGLQKFSDLIVGNKVGAEGLVAGEPS